MPQNKCHNIKPCKIPQSKLLKMPQNNNIKYHKISHKIECHVTYFAVTYFLTYFVDCFTCVIQYPPLDIL